MGCYVLDAISVVITAASIVGGFGFNGVIVALVFLSLINYSLVWCSNSSVSTTGILLFWGMCYDGSFVPARLTSSFSSTPVILLLFCVTLLKFHSCVFCLQFGPLLNIWSLFTHKWWRDS